VRELFPGLWEKAPLERHIVQEGVSLLARDRAFSCTYSGNELRLEPRQSYSVLRARFDRWFSEQTEAKGAMLLTKVRVDDVVRRDGRIAGVIAGGDELLSDVVVACDGILSLVSEKAGLRSPGKPHDYAVGVKEVITLDSAVIEDRFNLGEGEGAARLYVGDITEGKFGGGFLYTNRDSISLGIVLGIEDAAGDDKGESVARLLDAFKQRPEIAPLIKGGTTAEYAAHVIPEGGFNALGKLYSDGILVAGDAAGFALNIGFTVRGMEYALASGYYAAQAVIKAREKNDFSAGSLSVYQRLLEDSFVLKDFRNFQEAPGVVANPRFAVHYPELVGRIMSDLYSVPAGPKDRIYPTVKKHLTVGEMWGLFKDLRGMMKI